MIFEAIAAIELANQAINGIKELAGHVTSVGQMGKQLTQLADAHEELEKDADAFEQVGAGLPRDDKGAWCRPEDLKLDKNKGVEGTVMDRRFVGGRFELRVHFNHGSRAWLFSEQDVPLQSQLKIQYMPRTSSH